MRHRFAHLLVIMVGSVHAAQTPLVETADWASNTAREQLVILGLDTPHATTLARVRQLLDADARHLQAENDHTTGVVPVQQKMSKTHNGSTCFKPL